MEGYPIHYPLLRISLPSSSENIRRSPVFKLNLSRTSFGIVTWFFGESLEIPIMVFGWVNVSLSKVIKAILKYFTTLRVKKIKKVKQLYIGVRTLYNQRK